MLARIFLLLSICSLSYAQNLDRCYNIASTHYKVPSKLLKAIAKTETKYNPYAVHWNNNKTYDIGIMQINSTWLPKLNRVGITQADLLDGCKNIQVGAWILASNIKQYGFNNKAIGAYNARTSYKQEIYARKVLSNIEMD